MNFRLISFLSPEENIYFDEVLFRLAEDGKGEETLRFWESRDPFIVLGKTSKRDQDLIETNVACDHIPIIRRCTAGGTVVQAKGCLNFTCVLEKSRWPQMNTIRDSYQFILGKVLNALEMLDVHACLYSPCDLALQESNRKISGNAQRRGKRFILHHGTILYAFDPALAQKYLAFPRKTPDYRADRDHLSFIDNINRDPKDIIRCIGNVFCAQEAISGLSDQEKESLFALIPMKRAE